MLCLLIAFSISEAVRGMGLAGKEYAMGIGGHFQVNIEIGRGGCLLGNACRLRIKDNAEIRKRMGISRTMNNEAIVNYLSV